MRTSTEAIDFIDASNSICVLLPCAYNNIISRVCMLSAPCSAGCCYGVRCICCKLLHMLHFLVFTSVDYVL